jgi:hypothetical protein
MVAARSNLVHVSFLRPKICAAIYAFSIFSVSVEAQAPSDFRLALVIGNAAYDGAPLLNPINDATAMSKALRSMGFAVVTVVDANKEQIERAVSDAASALKGKNGVECSKGGLKNLSLIPQTTGRIGCGERGQR